MNDYQKDFLVSMAMIGMVIIGLGIVLNPITRVFDVTGWPLFIGGAVIVLIRAYLELSKNE